MSSPHSEAGTVARNLSHSVTDTLFIGGGTMGTLMRAHDWSQSSLGSPEGWPETLRPALSICIGSRFPIAIYWGRDLALLYNDAWSPILGGKHPWALGRPAREVWPEIWAEIGPLFDQVLQTGQATYTHDGLLAMHRHGYTEECYFNFTFTPIRGEGGRVEGVFNAVNETTYRVISERRNRNLRELSEHLSTTREVTEACRVAAATLSANAHDAPFCLVYLLSADGRVAELASSSANLHESLATPSIALGSADDDPWRLADRLGGTGAYVVSDLSAHAEHLPAGPWPEKAREALVVPFRATASQAVSGFLILGASPRRAVDDEYKQFAERAAVQLAGAMANAAAYEIERKRAEQLAQLDRAKTAFFSNVSHELRTPLTLILGPTEDALAAADRALSGESLVAVHRNAQRLLKLVNTLLEFVRLEAGRAQASYVRTNLGRLTEDLGSNFRTAIERAGLRFHVSCDDVEAFVDQAMWERIILNLLSNALKFTFAGAISLRVRDEGGMVVTEVSDTGVGIPVEELPRMFERFHRISGAKARSHEGSGIGLALVSELVKLHGGAVSVTSELGSGTTFRVELPRGCAHLPSGAVQMELSAPHASTGQGYVEEAMQWLGATETTEQGTGAGHIAVPPGSFQILVVDDNADMRRYLTRLLSATGWQVTACANGAEALDVVSRQRPDLVLTDVMMPGVDGFQLLRVLKTQESTRSIPVMMLSARAGEEARIDGIEAGADDYVVKPFSGRELVARVALQLQLSTHRAAVHAERKKLRALFEQAPFALGMFEGPSHRVVLANRMWAQLMGRPIEAGLPLVDAVPELRGQPVLELHDRALAGETIMLDQLPVHFRNTAGELEERFFRCMYQPLRNDEGDITGHLGMSVEVTTEVRTRAELEKARKAAEHANRAKDDFLALLGHELRNPLAPIATALSLMELRGLAGWDRERAIIARQVKHLTSLVDDLLDVSRIARGKIELQRTPIELAEVVARAVETASPLFEVRQQHLHVAVAASGLPVDVDAHRMQQVVSNLLTNAAKYTDQGGHIWVDGSLDAEEVCLRVADSGIGIEPEMLPHVFDLFVQERQAIDRSRGGLGLGLSIVRSIVALHGGSVSARSDGRGHGSVFTVRLPAAERHAGSQRAPVNSVPSVAPQRHRGRVLVVDDNEDAAELMVLSLEQLGYEVRCAHDGPGALSLSTEFTPEVAILDIGLPGMDGYELARRVRAERASSYLIALTGYGQPDDRKRALEAGFEAHLVKPVDLNHLQQAIAYGLAQARERLAAT